MKGFKRERKIVQQERRHPRGPVQKPKIVTSVDDGTTFGRKSVTMVEDEAL